MRKETCINQTAVRNAVLVVFSLIFYAWGEPMDVLLMIFSVFINFLVGIGIDKQDKQDKHRKLALIIGLVFNLLILGTFKYAGFIAESLNFIVILYIPKYFIFNRCI